MTHKERAEKLLHQKYHCSQALFGAYAGDFGLDLKTAFKISTCFGGRNAAGRNLRMYYRISIGPWNGNGIL